MAKHLIVISQDALVYEDLAKLKEMPVFGSIWARMAFVDQVRSVYPTMTYPVHTSIRTGVAPGRHGILRNECTHMDEGAPQWQFFQQAVKAPDLFDLAKAAGLTTASVFWPVTGNHPSIDYLVNEYWPQHELEGTADCFRHTGSSDAVIRQVVAPSAHLVDGRHRQHPYADQFVTACACAMIRAFKPNLLMLHPANIDGYRHRSGLFSPLVDRGLCEIDLWLGDILKAVGDAGLADDTHLAVISDHGQMEVRGLIRLNVLLREQGLIRVDEQGRLSDYTAMVRAAGLSAHVYVKEGAGARAAEKVYRLLCRWRDEGIYGIERVYTAREAREEEDLYGGFAFVLEGNGIYAFDNSWVRPLVSLYDQHQYRPCHGAHGHHPDKGPQPVFMVMGPDIRPGVHLPRRSILDQAPTFARLLGLTMPGTQGTVMGELLKDPG